MVCEFELPMVIRLSTSIFLIEPSDVNGSLGFNYYILSVCLSITVHNPDLTNSLILVNLQVVRQ